MFDSTLTVEPLTLGLLVALVCVYGLEKLLKPHSLVHPLLLGRQADVGRVRMPGESAIYRNYATGLMGRLPERPKAEVKTLSDLITDDAVAARTLWGESITNAQLKERVTSLGKGFVTVAKLVPKESTALLLLDDSIEFLLAELALASVSVASFTLSSLRLLIPTLERHSPTTIIVTSAFLDHILEHVVDLKQAHHHSIIVVGNERDRYATLSAKARVPIISWEDVEHGGKAATLSDIPSPQPDDVFNISIFEDQHENIKGTRITHANVTAGVTATRVLLPMSTPISNTDHIFSMHSPGTPYGRALAYTALYEGCSFSSVSSISPDVSSDPTTSDLALFTRSLEHTKAKPTLVFASSRCLEEITKAIVDKSKAQFLSGLAWRHKRAALVEGYLAKDTYWDAQVFKAARNQVLQGSDATIRGVIVSGGPIVANTVDAARIALSVPLVVAHTSPLVCGPVLATHPLDLQSFPEEPAAHVTYTHVGPPSANVEAKLVDIDEKLFELGWGPNGDLVVRGPSVGSPLVDGVLPGEEGWVILGEKGRVQSNGTFKIRPRDSNEAKI